MSAPLRPDVCVIGAGSAGLTVAAAARAVGLSVVLIERGVMGGECLNTGCVPSKALIAAARHAEAVRRAAAFGVTAGAPVVDGAAVHRHLRAVIEAIAPHDSQDRFEGLGAVVIRASARFTGPDLLEAGDTLIRARRFVVATGSRPALPPVPGLADGPVLTNESVFDLTALPAHLAVIGAGAVAVELAQAFRRLGSRVTVLARSRLLSGQDPELAAVVAGRLAAEGVAIRERATVDRVEWSDGGTGAPGAVLHLAGGGEIAASHVLAATGRVPVVDGLGLDAAGVRHDGRGIETDRALRTANRRIFAIGDVGRQPRFTHWAGYQGGLVVRSILTGLPARVDPDRIAWSIFTDPELAHVGLTEAEARVRYGGAVRVLRAPFSGNDRARADRADDGLVKLVVGRRGRILGAGIVGPEAGELAALVALAVAGRLRLSAFAAMVLPYPTLAEAVKRAAVSSYSERLKEPATARLVAAVRAVGRWIG